MECNKFKALYFAISVVIYHVLVDLGRYCAAGEAQQGQYNIDQSYPNERVNEPHMMPIQPPRLKHVRVGESLPQNLSFNSFDSHHAIRYPNNQERQHKSFINLEQYMKNISRPVGAKAQFYCDILGQPIPNFQWYKNRQQLNKLDSRLRVKTGLWGSHLRIDKLQSSDEGLYTCVGTNSAGAINATAKLRVTEIGIQNRNTIIEEPRGPERKNVPTADGFCQEFHSNVCGKFLLGHLVFVNGDYHQAMIETEISKFLKLTASQPLHRIREDCLRKLMEVTCYYNFPLCLQVHEEQTKTDSLQPIVHHPFYLCQEDCQSVMEDKCQATYNYLQHTLMHSVPTLMMDCSLLPRRESESPDNCRAIGKPVPTFLTEQPSGLKDDRTEQHSDDDENINQPIGPDLIPLFVSVGVMFLVGFMILAFCFLCRRTSNMFSDSSAFFSRSTSGLGFGRLNGTSCGQAINDPSVRGQGVGATKEYPCSKKRLVPGMGSHIKLTEKKKNGLLTSLDDGYTLAYTTNANAIRSNSESSNNFSSGMNPFVNGLTSLSSGPNSQIQSTNESFLKFNANSTGTYHPYQAPTFVTQPSLPPPNGPAPPPPTQTSQVSTLNNGGIFLPSGVFSLPPTAGPNNGSASPSSHGQTQDSRGSGEHELQSPFMYEMNFTHDSPTAYTTLRGSSPNGTCFTGRLQGSFVKLDNSKLDGDRATYSVADLNKSCNFPTEYPLSQLRFGKQFGQGVFGPVYRAELLPSNAYENGLPISIIVKTLSAGSPATLQADFKREAQLISELDHPNVLSLLGVSLQNAPWCMIFEVHQYMDLCELLTLRRSTRAAGQEIVPYPGPSMTDAERLHLLAQIASGMEYLSSHRFVHRDLAARNILILNDQLNCKITDLGLARDCYGADYFRMHPHSLMFPIRWMPLEAILYGQFTVESDIWAYGVLIWEIWSGGMRPYPNSTDMEVLELIQNRQLLPITSGCPPEIYKFMLDCWNSEPKQRPTFRDCMQQISHWQYNLTVAGQWRSNSTPSSPKLNGVIRCSVSNTPQLNGVNATPAMRDRHGDHNFAMEVPELFTAGSPTWFDRYTTTAYQSRINCDGPNDGHTPSLSPDGSSSNEKGNSVPRFNPSHPNPFAFPVPYRSPYNVHKSPLPGLEMRLLPNTTTMYIPNSDSVL